MQPARPILALLLASLALAACAGSAATPSTALSPEASASPELGSPTVGASAHPVPSEDLGPFTCDLPIVEPGSVAIANIVDVRTGSHDGYDRVVFEFEQGTPELTLDRAVPPFTQDASGAPLTVEGDSFLRLTMRGGTKQTDAGTSSYDGPTDIDLAHPALVDVVEGGDFERQSTWYLGLGGADACARLLVLDGPPRIAIDVEHP